MYLRENNKLFGFNGLIINFYKFVFLIIFWYKSFYGFLVVRCYIIIKGDYIFFKNWRLVILLNIDYIIFINMLINRF